VLLLAAGWPPKLIVPGFGISLYTAVKVLPFAVALSCVAGMLKGCCGAVADCRPVPLAVVDELVLELMAELMLVPIEELMAELMLVPMAAVMPAPVLVLVPLPPQAVSASTALATRSFFMRRFLER